MGLVAGSYDFVIEQGSTFQDQVGYNDGNTPPTWANLTGWKAKCRVRKSANSPIVAEWSTDNGKLSLQVPTGQTNPGIVAFNVTSTDTAPLYMADAYPSPQNYLYELVVYDTSNPPNVIPLLSGNFIVVPSVAQVWGTT